MHRSNFVITCLEYIQGSTDRFIFGVLFEKWVATCLYSYRVRIRTYIYVYMCPFHRRLCFLLVLLLSSPSLQFPPHSLLTQKVCRCYTARWESCGPPRRERIREIRPERESSILFAPNRSFCCGCSRAVRLVVWGPSSQFILLTLEYPPFTLTFSLLCSISR